MVASIDFNALYQHGIKRAGSEAALLAYLPKARSAEQLAALSDAYYLSQISLRVFRAGMTHAVVDKRWPYFEQCFWGFEPEKMLLLNDQHFERFMQDAGLIRHLRKLHSIPRNAQMILDIAQEYGSFAKFLAQWPTDNIIALWKLLAKRGCLLGGRSAPSFLRMVGKDTFILTPDVCGALIRQKIIDQEPKSQSDLTKVQAAFNQLKQESQLDLCQLSCLLALTFNQSY